MSAQDLLFELGTEELPAGPLTAMATALHDSVIAGLESRGLDFRSSRWFATPRRLAVLVEALEAAAPDVERDILGPPAAAAKDADGQWTAAATGFARKQGIDVQALQLIDSDKGPRLGVRRIEPGAKATIAVPEVISEAVRQIPVAKRMRWGRERHEFLRPVQWLVLLLGDQPLPLSLFGREAGACTYGHRFHHPEAIALSRPGEYEAALKDAHVVADFVTRRAEIERQVAALAASGSRAVIDDDLLDEVTGLVEWPCALRGSFDPAFLDVPAAALISSMKEHQKYFHLVDDNEQLLPAFITVANIDSSDPAAIIAGNERVIRPRLSDAKFFFDTDKKTPLEDRGTRLEGVVFQQKLGTLAEKRDRSVVLAGQIAAHLDADVNTTQRAATLAKCDLVSDMVLEFPELQGIAGAHYARHDGESEAVASAIEQHYWPRFAGDALPSSAEAAAVALADRLDTLVGIFGIGMTPTGSKDPFALRRAALAVIRILIARGSDLTLHTLVEAAAATFPDGVLAEDTAARAVDYIIDRLPAWYDEQSVPVAVLRAVTATGVTAPADIDARVQALAGFAKTEPAVALAAANKRVANILSKSDATFEGEPSADLFVADEERTLFSALEAAETALVPLLAAHDYSAALAQLAALRDPVDRFFDNVMVNAEDPALRDNRLRLLAALRDKFVRIADIAQMAVSH